MKVRAPRRRWATVVAALAALMLAGGTAFAYFTGSGSGNGNGGLNSPVPVSLIPATPVGALYPGGTTNVVLTVSNSNVTAAHISTLALDPSQGTNGFSVDADHSGCTLSSLTYTSQSNGSAGWNVAGKSGSADATLALTLPNALAMAVTAPNACQGATFTVYLSAS